MKKGYPPIKYINIFYKHDVSSDCTKLFCALRPAESPVLTNRPIYSIIDVCNAKLRSESNVRTFKMGKYQT